MCGIAGIINFRGVPVRSDELTEMSSFLQERGPDDQGVWTDGAVGLAHTRLSIVDLSQLGHQPMLDSSGSIVISYNGEIYNFKALKSELSSIGATFKSNSDTEVLLEGFLAWGIEELLKKIDGMFAFVIYDMRNRTAFVCRDRLGKKPLYYFADEKQFKFSSDIRSISATTEGLSIDLESLDYYLSELSTPQPKTIWKQIRQVNPAAYLTVDFGGDGFEESVYWTLDTERHSDMSVEAALERTTFELTEAVKRRIHGDVPIGSFLSGGIDSGLVTAILALNSPEKIQSFTVGFEELDFSEAEDARRIAEKYDTDHHEILIRPSNVSSVLESLVDYVGEPFSDPSIVPTYYVSKEISNNVKVALSGDGGDELFGGYHEYKTAFEADSLRHAYPDRRQRGLRVALSKIAFRTRLSNRNLGHPNAYLESDDYQKLYRGMGIPFDERNDFYKDAVSRSHREFTKKYLRQVWQDSNQGDILPTLFKSSLRTRLLNNYLVKIDRASMINSLEVRSPFLDHHLMEWVFSIPAEFHLKGGTTKFLTRQIASRLLGAESVNKKKQGFGIPLDDWIRKELREFVNDILGGPNLFIFEFVRPEYLKSLFAAPPNFENIYARKVWSLLCLELWGRKFA